MNKPIRILYVDDYSLDRELVRHALEKKHGGFQVTEAATRQEFEARLAERDYDLVLSDFNILGFEGLNVIDAARAKDPYLPVIIVTGTGSEQIAVETMKRGAVDYVIKTPQHIQRLPFTIEAALEKKRLEHERQQAEQTLQRRDQILKAIAFAAERLLRHPGLEEGIPAVLTRLGEATGVSRIYILEKQDQNSFSQRYEWAAPGVAPQIENPRLQNFPLTKASFGRWAEMLDQGLAVQHLTRELSQDERQILEEQNVLSTVLVPIFVNGKRWGSIGFDECNSEREWSEAEIEVLRAAANVLGAAIQRRQAEKALSASEARLRAAIESLPFDFWIMDIDDRYTMQNSMCRQHWGDIVGKRPQDLAHDAQMLAAWENSHRQAFGGQQVVENEVEYTFEGEKGVYHNILTPVRDQDQVRSILGVNIDITERVRAQEELLQRNRELALLNRVSRTLNASLDPEQVFNTILEEMRHLLQVVACSIWLVDPQTDELVCRQVTNPQSEIMHGWRLAPGQGLAGWVVQNGVSLVVPDAQQDPRHYREIDRRTGLDLRSILTVPLQGKQKVIGVLQVVDSAVNRFQEADLALLEPLAATAAMAIENAQLYEQARQNAETKSVLLREVNHRVKNNLTAIIGLLYTARRHARVQDRETYRETMNELISRVRGLTTVHDMLSASEWAPLRLSDLASRVIHASLQALPRDKRMSVDVHPSPVQVTPNQAHHLALVLNELATNSAKYALQERDTASIAIHIAQDEDTVRCEFHDDGPGYPANVLNLEQRNVGFDLIQNIVHDNLHGELSLHNNQGATALIQFKTQVNGKQGDPQQ
jgi:PAS domain S-box-containing protein